MRKSGAQNNVKIEQDDVILSREASHYFLQKGASGVLIGIIRGHNWLIPGENASSKVKSFVPKVILTDAAKGFVSALEIMKGNGKWLDVCHLLCRWHVYEAIKWHCAQYFKCHEQGTQRA